MRFAVDQKTELAIFTVWNVTNYEFNSKLRNFKILKHYFWKVITFTLAIKFMKLWENCHFIVFAQNEL